MSRAQSNQSSRREWPVRPFRRGLLFFPAGANGGLTKLKRKRVAEFGGDGPVVETRVVRAENFRDPPIKNGIISSKVR